MESVDIATYGVMMLNDGLPLSSTSSSGIISTLPFVEACPVDADPRVSWPRPRHSLRVIRGSSPRDTLGIQP